MDFINRVLRYPTKSDIITSWVQENYDNDILRLRRTEAVGWILNRKPDFVIDSKTLIDDFEFANSKDDDTIKTTIYLDLGQTIEDDLDKRVIAFDSLSVHTGKHKLCYRPYCFVTYRYTTNSKPDFSLLRQYFYNNLDKIKNQTMLWSIAYSHLPKRTKIKLLKQFYQPDLFHSGFNIAKKYKLVDLLIWLKEQPIGNDNSKYHIELNKKNQNRNIY